MQNTGMMDPSMAMSTSALSALLDDNRSPPYSGDFTLQDQSTGFTGSIDPLGVMLTRMEPLQQLPVPPPLFLPSERAVHTPFGNSHHAVPTRPVTPLNHYATPAVSPAISLATSLSSTPSTPTPRSPTDKNRHLIMVNRGRTQLAYRHTKLRNRSITSYNQPQTPRTRSHSPTVQVAVVCAPLRLWT